MLTIYKASAGSGKTYTLALEYIKLLLGVKDTDGRYRLNLKKYVGHELPYAHRRILAITFTNKATAEMKERILKELERLTHIPAAGEKDAPYAKPLTEEFGCSREELREVAERSLHALLNDYGQFNVSTIDAFFQTVLRSFAREIDRQGDFRLELDEGTVISQALSLLFDDVNNDPFGEETKAVSIWLDKMSVDRAGMGKDFNPFNRGSGLYAKLLASVKQSFTEEFMAHEAEMYAYLDDPRRLKIFERWLRSQVDSRRQEVNDATMELKQMLEWPTLQKAFAAALDKLSSPKLDDDLVKSVFNLDKVYIQNLDDRKKERHFLAKKAPDDATYDAVFDWFAHIKAVLGPMLLYQEMLDKADTLWAMVYVHRFIDRYRQDNNLILISDTNSLLGSIISESDTPFIYERVGMELENFLIDEFQDTSGLQWRNLRPLLANAQSSDTDSLIIGDVKQSIYRWRGGDPELLAHTVAERDFPRTHRIKGAAPGENTNYRSAHGVVKFNNTLFRDIAAVHGVDGYEGVAQQSAEATAGLSSCISFVDLTKDAFEGNARRLLAPEVVDDMQATGQLNAKTVGIRLMAEKILAQKARGYRFSDMAILCRDNKDSTEVAEYLLANFPDIRLVSDEALKLCNSPAVKMIISMLEIIDRNFLTSAKEPDQSVKAITPGGPVLIEDEKELRRRKRIARLRRQAMLIDSFNYFIAHGKSIDEAMQLAMAKAAAMKPDQAAEPDSENSLEADLDHLRKTAPSNLNALVEAIIDLKLTPDQRRDELPYITAFVDLVSSYALDFNPTIHSFLRYWRDNLHKLFIPAGDKVDAVTIMTVHKAKGLEWPCVHIPIMDWYFAENAEEQWFDMSEAESVPEEIRPPMMYLEPNVAFGIPGNPFESQLEVQAQEHVADNLNVAYVAFTRAGRELHVGLMTPGKSKGTPTMADAVLEAFRHGDPGDPELYTDLHACCDDAGNFLQGEPTAPAMPAVSETVAFDDKDDEEYRPSVVFNVSFNPANQQLTRLVDLTSPDEVWDDPDIGNEQPDREIVDQPVDPVMEAAARHGLILHSILAQMYTIDDLDKAIEYHRRDIPADELGVYRREILEAFAKGGEQARAWFAPDNVRVLNEQSIYQSATKANFRADRIIWTPQGTVEVVDYKFTSAPRKSHYRQVREYATMLTQMGYGPVKASLWYPLLGQIIEV